MTHFHELLLTAFLMGIGSSGHCLMMCGGISSALSSHIQQHSWQTQTIKLLLFHAGRITTYSMAGFLLGSTLGKLLTLSAEASFTARLVSALLIIIIGLYIAGFNRLLRPIEQRFAFIWRHIQPYTQRYLRMNRWHHAYLLGGMWGFLPCGMIYSTALWAASASHDVGSAALMLSFGLGTLPVLLSSNFVSTSFIQQLKKRQFKFIIGALIIAYGIFSLVFLPAPNSHQHHSEHHSHH